MIRTFSSSPGCDDSTEFEVGKLGAIVEVLWLWFATWYWEIVLSRRVVISKLQTVGCFMDLTTQMGHLKSALGLDLCLSRSLLLRPAQLSCHHWPHSVQLIINRPFSDSPQPQKSLGLTATGLVADACAGACVGLGELMLLTLLDLDCFRVTGMARICHQAQASLPCSAYDDHEYS